MSDSVFGLRLRQVGVVACAALIALSCHHAPTKPSSPADEDAPSTGVAATPVKPTMPAVVVAKEGPSTLLAKPLTAAGENSQARFSLDSARVVFISRARPSHKQAQIYELHLGLMKEKRVTFHDGDDGSPSYSPDGEHFLFSSTTDAIKEEKYAARQLMKTYYPAGLSKEAQDGSDFAGADLYLQTLNGRTIERLTRSSGLNAQPDMDPKGRRTVFVSVRGATDEPRIYILTGKTQARVTNAAGADHSPRFSPDSKALVYSHETSAGAQLMLAQGDFTKPVVLGGVAPTTPAPAVAPRDVDPSWLPKSDRVVFASNRLSVNYNLYSIDRAGTCMHRLTTADFDQREPAVSPDGKHLVFTGHRADHDQIYVMDYIEPATCVAGVAPMAAAPNPTPKPHLLETVEPTPTPSPNPAPAASPAPASAPSATPTPLQH